MKGRLGLAIVPLVDILLVLLALLILLVTVPVRPSVAQHGTLPKLEGQTPPEGLEVTLNAQGELTGRAATWALPKAGEPAVLHCQEAGIWRLPVIRLRADARANHGAVMQVVSFFQACEIGEVAIIGDAPAPR